MSSLIPIPARTPQSACRSCGQSIYWAPHPATGRPHPISTNDDEAEEPTPFHPGQGISHFTDCEFADQHRAPRATAPVRQLRRDLAPATPLEVAELVPLMGDSTRWDGYGSKPLGVVPDKVLRAARRWFTQKLNEQGDRRDERFERQVDAITIILEHREANSPQQSLAL
jgi:hypothetical protein